MPATHSHKKEDKIKYSRIVPKMSGCNLLKEAWPQDEGSTTGELLQSLPVNWMTRMSEYFMYLVYLSDTSAAASTWELPRRAATQGQARRHALAPCRDAGTLYVSSPTTVFVRVDPPSATRTLCKYTVLGLQATRRPWPCVTRGREGLAWPAPRAHTIIFTATQSCIPQHKMTARDFWQHYI